MRLHIPLTLAALALSGCPQPPQPCLWVVTNGIGTLDAPTRLESLHLRAPDEPWGENVLGEVEALPFGESLSFRTAPGTPSLDLRGIDADGTTWSRFAAASCSDGERIDTVLTADDLDIPCTWTVTNRIGDSAVNYALLDLWARVSGTYDWGENLLADPIGWGDSVELTVDVGWTYDLSALDQGGVISLRLADQTCTSGQELETTLTVQDEAPPCIWEVTNEIDGDLGPLHIVALAVTPSGSGSTTVYDLAPVIGLGEVATAPFFPRAIYDLQAIDELGFVYSYLESALCLDGGELYGLDVVWEDRDAR